MKTIVSALVNLILGNLINAVFNLGLFNVTLTKLGTKITIYLLPLAIEMCNMIFTLHVPKSVIKYITSKGIDQHCYKTLKLKGTCPFDRESD